MQIQNNGQVSVTLTDDGNGDITIDPGQTVTVDDQTGEYLKTYTAVDTNGNNASFIEI